MLDLENITYRWLSKYSKIHKLLPLSENIVGIHLYMYFKFQTYTIFSDRGSMFELKISNVFYCRCMQTSIVLKKNEDLRCSHLVVICYHSLLICRLITSAKDIEVSTSAAILNTLLIKFNIRSCRQDFQNKRRL